MKVTKRGMTVTVILWAVAMCILICRQGQTTVSAEVRDGVMGSGIIDETSYEGATARLFAASRASSSYSSEFLNASFQTKGSYTNADYYHKNAYKNRTLLNGIDVSWWQSTGDKKTTALDWKKIHDAGIDFAFVRAASRDSSNGSLYEDTCADSHIRGAAAANIDVGLYVFSQALTEKEASEEAEYLLKLLKKYNWKVTMPIVIDREKGTYNRLTEGKLSRAKETAVCQAFADTIHAAGYDAYVYASYSWIKNYIDTATLKNCGIWIARYNNTTTSNSRSGVPYQDTAYDYDFWQYSSVAKISGYSGSLDVNFWYKDTKAKTTGLKMTDQTTNSITIGWSAAKDAPRYRVYRYNSEEKKYVYIGSTTKKSFTDSGLAAGKIHRYRVRGWWKIGGKNYYGAYSDELEATTLPTKVSGLEAQTQTSTKIALFWNRKEDASGYCVYRLNSAENRYERIAVLKGDSVRTYVDQNLSTGVLYQYKVRAYKNCGGTKYYGSCSDVQSAVTKPAKVGGVKLTSKSSAVTLNWNQVRGADGYRIYRLNTRTGKYERVRTLMEGKKTDYVDSKLQKGKTYTYKVRSFKRFEGKTYFGACSAEAKIKVL